MDNITTNDLNPEGVELTLWPNNRQFNNVNPNPAYLTTNQNGMGTYKQIFYHIIFSTKNREPSIAETYCHELYNYIFGIIKEKGGLLCRINGAEDHLHIFSDLRPSVSLSDYIKDIKVASSLWMKASDHFLTFTAWQEGYGAFTHSIREKEAIVEYIKGQKEHHKKETFYDEYKRLLTEAGIEFNEKYLL